MRIAWYAGASTAAAAACLLKAFHERPNFYSATVYLSQSNACLLILTNLLLIGACSMVYALQRLLYGPLRPIEIEQLSEKAWYAVLDTLLAMPSFREDVGGWLLTMFVLLLAGKVWGWIGEGRVDILEQQPPANPRLFHARLANSLIFSVIFDVWMTCYCIDTVIADPRPGMMVIFTFEFAILTVFSTFTLCRYVLSLTSTLVSKVQMQQAIEERKTEIQAERAAARQADPEATVSDDPIEVDENELDVPGWEEKRRWLFGLEMTVDFLKLLLYIIFFTVSITFNGLPMHIMRDVYMTFASFTKRLGDYVNYKKATSDMNVRYPDATTEEIRGDACIVCREDMIAWLDPVAAQAEPGTRPRRDEGLRAKKLPCGHILHLRCLKAWLERQQVCPTCRRPVIAGTAPTTNNAPANAPRQNAPAAAPGAAPNAPQQRPAQNRARFFNLGPLRVGLLNAPAGQMDNIVNQLRDPQAQQAQPGAQPVPMPTAQAPTQPTATQSGLTNDARLSQNELSQIAQRMQREAGLLNVEQQQLVTIRAMGQELNRLMMVHNHNAANGHMAQPAPQMPIPPFTFQPSIPQAFNGRQSQALAAGSESLPQGMVLPEGWTLMPLQRQQHLHQGPALLHFVPGVATHAPSQAVPSQAAPSQAVPPQAVPPQAVPSQAAPSQAASPQQVFPQAVPARAVPASAPEAVAPTTHSAVPSVPSSSDAVKSSDVGPTDDAGSPLFVPTKVAEAHDSTHKTTAQDGSAATSTAQPQASQQAPWNRDEWSFDNAQQPDTSHDGSTQTGESSKGKGRAVEIEDAADADS